MRHEPPQTIKLEEETETVSATTPKADGPARQVLFASYGEDFQSAIGSLNERDLLRVTEGTRIALRQDAEGRWVWAFVPPAPEPEAQLEDGLDPVRLAAIEEYKRKLAELEKARPIWETAEVKHKLAETQRRLREDIERAERLEKIRREEQAEEEVQRRKWAEDAAQAQKRTNELAELKTLLTDLSKEVCDNLYALLCACAGHLVLTPPLLEHLDVDSVEAGWEEVKRQKEALGEEREDRTNRTEKGWKGKSRHQRGKVQEGRRPLDECKVERQQEEGWQEVSASFGLSFETDSASVDLVSWYGQFEFSDLYCLDWDLLMTSCRFLCLSSPPSILLNRRLVPLVQLCCLVVSFSTAIPNIDIFDYTTYPDLVMLIE